MASWIVMDENVQSGSTLMTTYYWQTIDRSEITGTSTASILVGNGDWEECRSESDAGDFRHFRHFDSDSLTWTYLSEARREGSLLTLNNENLERLTFCLESAHQCEEKLIYVLWLRSGGVKLTHNRSIFSRVWGVQPHLYRLRKKHLLVTVAHEKCLGAAAVYFATGELRIAVGDETQINLTGAGVISGFFGSKDELLFEVFSSAGHQFNKNNLIQEMYANEVEAVVRIKRLRNFLIGAELGAATVTDSFLCSLTKEYFEIFPQLSQVGRSFLARIDGLPLGILLQPLNNPRNLIDHRMVERWTMALRIFRVLKLPLLVGIDSPGADPRQNETEDDLLLSSVSLVESLVNYPFPKMGILLNRCYGGSGIFSLLKEHGSLKLAALSGAKVGVVGNGLLEQIVSAKPNLREEWEETKRYHKAMLADMREDGIIDAYLEPGEAKGYVWKTLGGGIL